MKVLITPAFNQPDKGDGGIRRVVEAQQRHLPEHGIEVITDIREADLVASHGAELPNVPVGIPWVTHCHGLYWKGYDWQSWGPRVNAAVIAALKRADHATTPSRWVAYALERGMWLRPTVLTHGIEPEDWPQGDSAGYVLWNKGRTDPISDPTPVNRLASLARDVKFKTTFGSGAPNVEVVGVKPYQAAKLDILQAGVYLCTARETFGIGTLEAMAAGVPVLGWAWGGQREIIRHGETGWLAPPGDYENLLEGLHWCLEHRAQIGAAARADVLARFTWASAIERYARLYEGLVEGAHAERPKVTVVSPCYNLGRLLPSMVDSVLAQSMGDWELVIVDDCSTDDSLKAAQEIAASDPRIRVVQTPENLGLPGALNVGWQAARGRYVMNLDPDNMIMRTCLATLSAALDGDRGIDIAYGRVKFVLEDGATPDPVTGNETGISTWPRQFNGIAQLRHQNQIPSTSLVRREVYEQTGGYRRRAKVAEDAEFWCRAISYGAQPRMVTEDVMLVYRYRPDSKSRGETQPDWTSWLPWAKQPDLLPFAATVPLPGDVKSLPVDSYEPAVLTVIIPVGPGHAEAVIDAIDSVEAQTFRAWHVIVVNDTGEPLTVPQPWVSILTTGERGAGPGRARNIGIAACQTAAFVLLDADDILEPTALAKLYDAWREAGRSGTVYGQWWDDKGGDDITVWNPPGDWNPVTLVTGGCIHASCALYTRREWEAVGGFDEALRNWEDWDYQIALATKGFCSQKLWAPLFTYRKLLGKRREESAAEHARGEAEMKRKWPDLWDGSGKERLAMGCSSCGKKSKPAAPIAVGAAALPATTSGEAVLIEYLGSNPKAVWNGRVTRKRYIFGSTEAHRRKFVYAADAEGFLAMPSQFRRVQLEPRPDKPTLQGVMSG